MIKDKIVNWVYGSKVVGLTITILDSDSYLIDYVLLEKKKDEIVISDSGTDIDNIDLLVGKLGIGIPYTLNVSGKGILSRVIESLQDKEEDGLVKEILHDANKADFAFRFTRINSHQYYASIARNDFLSELIQKLTDKGASIVYVDLGLNSIEVILPSLFDFVNIQSRNLALEIENAAINKIDRVEISETNSFSLLGERLTNKIFLSYCTALNFYKRDSQNSSLALFYKKQAEEYAYGNVYKHGKLFLGLLLFSLLLVNFLVFNYYYQKTGQANQGYEQSSVLDNKIDSIKLEISSKEKLYRETGFDRVSKNSFFIDRLAASVPAGVKISLLEVNPIVERISEDKIINVLRNTIRIKGETNDIVKVKSWLDIVNSKGWVDNASLIDLSQSAVGGSSTFVMEIKVKNEF